MSELDPLDELMDPTELDSATPSNSPVPTLLAEGRVAAVWIGCDGDAVETGLSIKADGPAGRAVHAELAEVTATLMRKPIAAPDEVGEVRWLADGGARNAAIKQLAKRLRQLLEARGPLPSVPDAPLPSLPAAPTRTILGELISLPASHPSSPILATLHDVYQRLKELQRQQRTVRFRWTVTAPRSA